MVQAMVDVSELALQLIESYVQGGRIHCFVILSHLNSLARFKVALLVKGPQQLCWAHVIDSIAKF